MLERIAEQPRLTSTADIGTQNKMTPSHFSFVSHFPLAFFFTVASLGMERTTISSNSDLRKDTAGPPGTEQSWKSLLAMSKAQLFPTTTPKGAPVPDSFIITHKPGLHKIKGFSQSSIWTNQGMLKSYTAAQVTAHHLLWDSTYAP